MKTIGKVFVVLAVLGLGTAGLVLASKPAWKPSLVNPRLTMREFDAQLTRLSCAKVVLCLSTDNSTKVQLNNDFDGCVSENVSILDDKLVRNGISLSSLSNKTNKDFEDCRDRVLSTPCSQIKGIDKNGTRSLLDIAFPD